MVGRLRCDEPEQACEKAVVALVAVLLRYISERTGEATNTSVKIIHVPTEVHTGHLYIKIRCFNPCANRWQNVQNYNCGCS